MMYENNKLMMAGANVGETKGLRHYILGSRNIDFNNEVVAHIMDIHRLETDTDKFKRMFNVFFFLGTSASIYYDTVPFKLMSYKHYVDSVLGAWWARKDGIRSGKMLDGREYLSNNHNDYICTFWQATGMFVLFEHVKLFRLIDWDKNHITFGINHPFIMHHNHYNIDLNSDEFRVKGEDEVEIPYMHGSPHVKSLQEWINSAVCHWAESHKVV
tara:strand:- start:603 stop:1244 length:642 start_codon:yes stop_codon:yes gene_type:complete